MYYIIYGFFYLISLLPWFILYGLSDFLAMLVYHVFKYRKDVVMSNLAIAFPEKSEDERKRIAKDFYRLFTDTMVETIKLISLSKKGLLKKFTGDLSMINEAVDKGKNIQLHAMHNFNWEYINLNVVLLLRYPFLGVYMPMKSKIFEKITSGMRGRYNTVLIPAPQFKKIFLQYANKPHVMALVADQNPSSLANSWWLPFFGKMTPFVKGPEKGARSNNTAVFFVHFFPIRRGHYSISTKLVTMNAAEMPEGELTRQFVTYVEESIRKYPANYLWSHRRWKHEYSSEYETIGGNRM